MKKFTQATLIALLISSSIFSQTKDESVRNTGVVNNVYQAGNSRLILLSPADGKLFNSSEGSKPVLFRWTAVVPKPKEAVTYQLKVWQLMQGQNSTEAMRSNQPIVTKDVANITQAAISNLYTGPCRPPYLCDFVWAVEVLNRDGGSINNSYPGPNSYSFKFNVENPDVVQAETDNKGNAGMPTGKSLNNQGNPAPVNSLNGLPPGQPRVVGLNGLPPGQPGIVSLNGLPPGEPGIVSLNGLPPGEPGIVSLNGLPPGEPGIINLNGLPPGQPIVISEGTNAQGDPVHGVDVKLGMKKLDKEPGKEKKGKSTKSSKKVSFDVVKNKKA